MNLRLEILFWLILLVYINVKQIQVKKVFKKIINFSNLVLRKFQLITPNIKNNKVKTII